jgi:hypothetical protein
MVGGIDVKATALYEIEMLGYTEEAAILKHNSVEDIYRLAEYSRDTDNADGASTTEVLLRNTLKMQADLSELDYFLSVSKKKDTSKKELYDLYKRG